MGLKFAKSKRVPKNKEEDKLWKVFSEFIRLRDTDRNGYGKCPTCGSFHHWKDADAGHFISRKYKATKFDEKNVSFQCKKCNRFENGQQFRMALYIDDRWGMGTAERIETLSRAGGKIGRLWINQQIEYYRLKVKAMKKEKGVF